MKRTEIVSKAPWKTVPHRSISRCPLEPKNVSTELLLWRFLLVTCVTGNTSEGQSVWILFLQQIRKFCVHSYNIFISLSTLPPRKMFCITFSHHHFCTMFSEVRWKRSINVNIFFAKKEGKMKKNTGRFQFAAKDSFIRWVWFECNRCSGATTIIISIV